MKEIIKYEDLITASGSYPDRLNNLELTIDIKENAKILLEKINSLLNDHNITQAKVSSGFRPSTTNSSIKNAAKKSAHMVCKECDIEDTKDQKLGKLILSKPELLRKYGLFIEDLKSTKGKYTNWIHLDMVERKDRPSRSFIP